MGRGRQYENYFRFRITLIVMRNSGEHIDYLETTPETSAHYRNINLEMEELIMLGRK